MRSALGRVHALLAWAFVASIVVQVLLAGLALAELGGSGDFGTHVGFGYFGVGIVALALLLSAVVARRPRRDVGIAAGLFVLYLVQTALPGFRGSLPGVAALHPLNAMVLFVGSIWYARRTWSATRRVGSPDAER